MSELGETVGILAAQSIGEPGTQLTMRTFHTGGIFSGQVEQILISPTSGIINYNTNKTGRKINTKYKEKAFLTMDYTPLIISKKEGKTYSLTIPPKSLVFVKPKQKVYNKQIIAQIIKAEEKIKRVKETKEIDTNISGSTIIENNKIWVVNSNIISYEEVYFNLGKKQRKHFYTFNKFIKWSLKLSLNNFTKIKPRKCIKIEKLNYVIEKKLKTKKQILVNKKESDQLLRIQTKKTLITNLLSKNEKIIKNHKNKYDNQIIQKRKNHVLVRKSKKHTLLKRIKTNIETSAIIKKNSSLLEITYKKQKSEDIVQGLPKIEQLLEIKKISNSKFILNNPDEKLKVFLTNFKKKYTPNIATRKSIQKLQKYLINKIQEVYISQGVNISNKHIEIIIKQMTSKVIINESKNSTFLTGEIVELNRIEKTNLKNENKATYEPIVIGISKIAQANSSFISQASFQETIKTLSIAALKGNTDWLNGLKENIIIGNLIPAGTNASKVS